MRAAFLFLFSLIFFSNFAHAKVVKLTLRKSTPVYAKATFDSPIIANLKRGDKIYGTKRPKPSGFGYFHKVRVKKGVYGYIPDTSVEGFKKKGKLANKDKRKKKVSKKRKSSGGGISGRASYGEEGIKKKSKVRSYKTSLLKERSVGLSLSQINYKLDTKGQSVKSGELFFGFKLSGGGWGLTRVPLDLNFMFSPSAPSSIDDFASDGSGYIALVDLSLPLEWARGKHWSVFISLGLALSHYNFDFVRAGVAESTGATEFGGTFRLGSGYRFGTFIARLEAQYINVGTDHLGLNFSLQRVF
jgi:hypothetical protein